MRRAAATPALPDLHARSARASGAGRRCRAPAIELASSCTCAGSSSSWRGDGAPRHAGSSYRTTCTGCSEDSGPPEAHADADRCCDDRLDQGLVLYKGTPKPRKPLSTGGDAACAQERPQLSRGARRHRERAPPTDARSSRTRSCGSRAGSGGFVPNVPDVSRRRRPEGLHLPAARRRSAALPDAPFHEQRSDRAQREVRRDQGEPGARQDDDGRRTEPRLLVPGRGRDDEGDLQQALVDARLGRRRGPSVLRGHRR